MSLQLEHIVELKVGDVTLDTWQRFRVIHDMLSPADSFDMTFGVGSWSPDTESAPIAHRLRSYAKSFAPIELHRRGEAAHGHHRHDLGQ